MSRIYLSIFVIALVTALIRFCPFLVFNGRKTPQFVTSLSKSLPYAVMGMLVVYCLKDMNFSSAKDFVPQILASFVTVITYVIRKNTLLSIISATVFYMILVQLVF